MHAGMFTFLLYDIQYMIYYDILRYVHFKAYATKNSTIDGCLGLASQTPGKGDHMDDRGLMHIYYGTGKGKTTAALGLALRAAGCGKSVVIVQFLKDWKCGELNSLELLPNVTVFRGKASGGTFIHEMSDEQMAETKHIHDENLRNALELHDIGKCDLLILDEAVDAYRLGVLDKEIFIDLLENKPHTLELVVTGHNPDAHLIECADYATEMVKRKHPYDMGVSARRGVEF